MSRIVNEALERLIGRGDAFGSHELAALAGVTRQAVHRHLRRLVTEGRLRVSGKARAVRYQKVVPLRQRVEVASAGSTFRLSARLLLLDVVPGEVTLDFTGVTALGEEFLEEVFLVWAPQHPAVTLRVAHLPAKLAAPFFAFARSRAGRTGAQHSAESRDGSSPRQPAHQVLQSRPRVVV